MNAITAFQSEADIIRSLNDGGATRKISVLVAINSCWRDLRNGSNQAIRDTWAKALPKYWDLRFFIGDRNFSKREEEKLLSPEWIGSPGTLGNMAPSNSKPAELGTKDDLLSDELLMPCSDQYLGLPFKTVESLKWALEGDYEFIFRAFTDTYAFPDRLLGSRFWDHDAVGWLFGCGPCPAHPTISHLCPLGGAGYFLSRLASKAVIEEPIRHWGEDTHVGFALHQAGLTQARDSRYIYNAGQLPFVNRAKLTIHLSERGSKWDPAMMTVTHLQQEAGKRILPNWSGKCKKCGSDRINNHPMGIRCSGCGSFAA